MEYKFGKKENYEDFSSGRVLYHGSGMTNFPARIAQELFGRCMSHSNKKNGIRLYDCCCGCGYLLTVLGFLNYDLIDEIVGSDVDEKSVALAWDNLSLLSEEGMNKRINQIRDMIQRFNKDTHIDAERSAFRLKDRIKNKNIKTYAFQANVMEPINLGLIPDIIITDVPYGSLVSWEGGDASVDRMLDTLYRLCDDSTIIGLSMDKKQKFSDERYIRLEKHSIGKRKIVLLKKGS